MMKNDYLEYYGKHSISPVKQDITDFGVHMKRRAKLYRQCGIPALAFRDAELLEAGPAGGVQHLGFFSVACEACRFGRSQSAGNC